MLDRDLAILYDLDTKQLKRSVRRNLDRFPVDFILNCQKKSWLIGGANLAPPKVKLWVFE